MASPCQVCGFEWWTRYGGCEHVGGTGYKKYNEYPAPRPVDNLPPELVAVSKVAQRVQRAEAAYHKALQDLDAQCEYALRHGFTPEQVELFAGDNYDAAAREALAVFRS